MKLLASGISRGLNAKRCVVLRMIMNCFELEKPRVCSLVKLQIKFGKVRRDFKCVVVLLAF